VPYATSSSGTSRGPATALTWDRDSASIVLVGGGGALIGVDVRAKNEAFRIPKLHSGAAIRDLDMSPSAPCIFTYIYI